MRMSSNGATDWIKNIWIVVQSCAHIYRIRPTTSIVFKSWRCNVLHWTPLTSFNPASLYSDSHMHLSLSVQWHTMLLLPSTLWLFTAPSTIADESQDYWSQTLSADAADMSNLHWDLIVGAAGIFKKEHCAENYHFIASEQAAMPGSFSVAQREMTIPLLASKVLLIVCGFLSGAKITISLENLEGTLSYKMSRVSFHSIPFLYSQMKREINECALRWGFPRCLCFILLLYCNFKE